MDGAGRPLMLRGTNLGNWLEPEGYMFHFGDNGPTSPREIEELAHELIGPEKAKRSGSSARDVHHEGGHRPASRRRALTRCACRFTGSSSTAGMTRVSGCWIESWSGRQG